MANGLERAYPSRKRTATAVAMCAAAFLYVFPYYPEINNPNENVRLYMTAALVEHGTYRINELRDRWGWVNDAAVRNGHYYSVKAPGTSLLGVPGYALYYGLAGESYERATALWVVRLTATILPMLLFFGWFYRWLGGRTRSSVARDTVFLSVALGSMLCGYTYLFVSHSVSAACAFGAFMLLYAARRRVVGHAEAWLAGLLAAGVTLFEYPGLLASVVLSAYALFVLRPWSRIVSFGVGGVVPTLAMMHFQWSCYGSPFRPGHLYVENPAFRAGHEEGFYGATTFHPEAAWALLFDFRWGLLVLTPVLVLMFWGFPRLLRDRAERPDALAALGVVVPTYVVICFMNNWTGGWSLGPRYLALVVPFVAWGALAGLDAWMVRAPRAGTAVALGATAAAFVASGIPSMYYPHIPPAIEYPGPWLFSVLIGHDFAPPNAGHLLGWHRTASMVPMALLGVLALGWSWRSPGLARPTWSRDHAAVLAGAAALAALLLWPQWSAPSRPPAADKAVALVTRKWSPKGHDRAARLRHFVNHADRATPEDWRRLAELYLDEGRRREAREIIEERRKLTNRRNTRTDVRAASPDG